MNCPHVTPGDRYCQCSRDFTRAFVLRIARRALAAARIARRWLFRFCISTLMLTGFLPKPMLREYLFWLREDLPPLDPRLPIVLQELAEVRAREERWNAPNR